MLPYMQARNMSVQQSNQAFVLFGFQKLHDEAIDLSLRLNNITTYNNNVKNYNNNMIMCNGGQDQEQEDIMEEEAEEKLDGVCTELKLYDDPWKIKKVLETSDVNHLSRVMISRRLVQEHIVQVWRRAERFGDVWNLEHGNGVRVKVWDCNRGKEYVLTLKKFGSSECYVFSGNWSRQFVKERGLKKGDEIGFFWCNSSGRFFFSILALAPPDKPV